MKRLLFLVLAWVLGSSATVALAAGDLPAKQQAGLVFSQHNGAQHTIYLAERDGSGRREVASGADLAVYIEGRHFLYVIGQKLYEYDPATQKSHLVHQFSEAKILVQVISKEPDQAIVAGVNDYQTNWYILEFSDDSVRKVDSPNFRGTSAGVASPDQSTVAIVKSAILDFRYGLTVKQNKKADWTLPNDLTVLPEFKWSPDSKWLAFYAKKFDSNLDGFYSLYLLDVPNRQLQLIQEKSFTVLFFSLRAGAYTPDWSADSKALIYSYQLYGTVGRTGLYEYRVDSGKKTLLTGGDTLNEYPRWAPDGRNIAFISTREAGQAQLYVMDERGEAIHRISPDQGTTEWALWYQPEALK